MTLFDNSNVDPKWERTAVPPSGGQNHLLISIKTPGRPSALPPAPVDVAFALDRSGSMNGEPIRLVKKAVGIAASLLTEKDRAALVVYDNAVDVIHPLQTVTAGARQQLRTSLDSIDARGSTNLGEGWMTACLQLADSAAPTNVSAQRLRRALLLTDGLANQGMTSVEELTEHAINLRTRGISTSTMGVGEHFDEGLLAAMAEAGGGNFAYIPSAAELSAFFQKELGRLLATIASNVVLTLTFSKGTSPRLLSNFPFRNEGSALIIELGDLPENEEQAVVVTMQTAQLAAGSTISVHGELTWSDPSTGLRHSAAIPVSPLTVAPEGSPMLEERDAEVSEQAALQQAALDQREAMRLDREGHFAESRRIHAQAASILKSAPRTERVVARLSEASAYALFQADEAMPEQMRKQAVHDSYRRGRGRSDES